MQYWSWDVANILLPWILWVFSLHTLPYILLTAAALLLQHQYCNTQTFDILGQQLLLFSPIVPGRFEIYKVANLLAINKIGCGIGIGSCKCDCNGHKCGMILIFRGIKSLCGPMDKALVYESKDCRFESCHRLQLLNVVVLSIKYLINLFVTLKAFSFKSQSTWINSQASRFIPSVGCQSF